MFFSELLLLLHRKVGCLWAEGGGRSRRRAGKWTMGREMKGKEDVQTQGKRGEGANRWPGGGANRGQGEESEEKFCHNCFIPWKDSLDVDIRAP